MFILLIDEGDQGMQTHSAATASSNVMPASCPCPHGRMWVMFSFYGVPPVWLQVALTTQVRRAVTATVMAVDIPEPIDYFQTLHDGAISPTRSTLALMARLFPWMEKLRSRS